MARSATGTLANPGHGETRHPWEQQPGESDRHYALFQRYLQLGDDRTYGKLVAALRADGSDSITYPQCKRIGAEWNWTTRAVAWDAVQSAPGPKAKDSHGDPWDQQPGEPDKYYARFQRYLQLGRGRTYGKLVAALRADGSDSITYQQCNRLGGQWNWIARAEAWDAAHPAPQANNWQGEPWEQQPGEKDRWYRVFRRYLELGPARNIHRAAMLCLEEDATSPVPLRAYTEARKRRWQERAEAWDSQEINGEEDCDQETAPVIDEPEHPWDRQPGEPMRAYGWFCHYLELGPLRTTSRAFHDLSNNQSDSAPTMLYMLARRWKWQQRAAAWDAYQRDLFVARVQDRRFALYERRLDVAEVYYDQAVDAMDTANIAGLTEAEARRMLPTIHTILKDMGAIQRIEMDYAEKQHKSEEWKPTAELLDSAWEQVVKRQEALKQEAAAQQAAAQQAAAQQATPGVPASSQGSRMLLVCVGPHPELVLDLAVLRAASNLDLHRLTDLTRANLANTLRRERLHGRPVELVHMAVHAGHDGIEFADGLVNGQWLSEQLAGVQVLMLSGCRTDQVGDWLRVVPYVVTLADDITHGDAALLAEQFWKGIGAGQDPTQALTAALNKTSPTVREFVTRHW